MLKPTLQDVSPTRSCLFFEPESDIRFAAPAAWNSLPHKVLFADAKNI